MKRNSYGCPVFYEKKWMHYLRAHKQPLDLRNQALLEVLYGTGIRVSECANLTVDAVDFQASVLLVHGKGNKDRYVPFGSFAQDALKDYLENGRALLMTKYQKTSVCLC